MTNQFLTKISEMYVIDDRMGSVNNLLTHYITSFKFSLSKKIPMIFVLYYVQQFSAYSIYPLIN